MELCVGCLLVLGGFDAFLHEFQSECFVGGVDVDLFGVKVVFFLDDGGLEDEVGGDGDVVMAELL